MADFKNILIAIDLSNEVDVVLEKAVSLAIKYESNISLVHIVEPVVIDVNMDFAPSINLDIESSLIERAEHFLLKTAKKLNLANVTTKVLVGSVKKEIHREALESQADLIIIGTHGRHGVARLLGSTASAVLHGAPCDVLTVKIA